MNTHKHIHIHHTHIWTYGLVYLQGIEKVHSTWIENMPNSNIANTFARALADLNGIWSRWKCTTEKYCFINTYPYWWWSSSEPLRAHPSDVREKNNTKFTLYNKYMRANLVLRLLASKPKTKYMHRYKTRCMLKTAH